jgi:hypothetical protein
MGWKLNKFKQLKNYVPMTLFFGTGSLSLLVGLIFVNCACAKYHSVLNEDPALLRSTESHSLVSISPPLAWKEIKKVVVIVLENSDVDSTLSLSHFNRLAKKGAFLSNYYGITHPSQPNYIAMISGSTQGVDSNSNASLPMKHIGDLLEIKGKTWRAYGEDYPGDCYLNDSSGNYVRKHMPFLSFENIQNNRIRCNQVVSAKNFGADLIHSNLADFSLFIPNQLNNGHDTGVGYANNWVGEKLLPMLEQRSPDNDTLFIITFDEGSYLSDNKIYTVLFGAGVQPGITSTRAYSHFSLLKTIEMIFGLPTLGLNDVKATFINDVWKTE